ncbi:glutathione S-transferase family protein [Asaia krungthepensis]|uniref:Glutathione S-transferase n=1 Tax=Asaia krungthepensis NRIC 0535 TaxID=1307925 RepID=A0ABQ0Q565_9PROT|nr:glutathione S-transferase family protein [Asaia krungthepensis]GBQ91801.1 glutathione S-transferase [Asaia krungthepensis NRIC 0535]
MLTLHGWMPDERSYAVRLAASFLAVPLAEVTDRRAEIYGPVLSDGDDVYCVGLVDIFEYFSRLPNVEWSFPDGEERTILKWALEGLGQFSTARRHALSAPVPVRGETEAVRDFFRALEDRLAACHLSGQPWLSGQMPGFIEIVVFPVAGLARDLGISMDLYPATRRFVHQLRQRPGFIVMPGIPSCH